MQGTVGQLRCAGRGRTAGADAPPCCISRAARDTIRTTPRCPRVAVGPRLHRGTQQAPAELGEMLSTLHGAAGCGGLLAAALREGRPPPRAAAKRSAATSQRGWRVGVPLPCTAVSGLPPLIELLAGRHRWAAAAGHLRPGVVCGVSLSSPVTVVKDIKRLIARRRRRGRRHGAGRGGGLYLGRRRPDIYRVARLEVSVGAADADLNLQPTPWQLYLYVTLSRGWSNSEGARIYGAEVARAFITPRHAAVPPYERARACGACVADTRKLSVWPMRPTSCCNSCFCTQQRRLWLCAGCRTNVSICMYGTHPSSATGRLEAVAGFCLQCAALSGRP